MLFTVSCCKTRLDESTSLTIKLLFANNLKPPLIDCRSRKGELVPFNDAAHAMLIINTNVRHSLADGEYGKRRAQCEAAAKTLNVSALRDATLTDLEAAKSKLDPLIYRRARHVIGENDRTTEAARCLRAGQWERLGKLMDESHASLRDDY